VHRRPILHVPGPNPKEQDDGYELIEEKDLDALSSQGWMLTGFETNDCLNLLSRRFHEERYKRLHSFVLTSPQHKRRKHGEASLRNEDFGKVYLTDPCTDEDVRKAPLVCVSWSRPRLDRTEYKPGIFVFYDSLPGYFSGLYNHAKSTLESSLYYVVHKGGLQKRTIWSSLVLRTGKTTL
jgi:hypothetical protein